VNKHIWLGSAYDAQDITKLKENNVSCILNCADDVENFHPDDFLYCNLSVKDFGQDAGMMSFLYFLPFFFT
jgi:hypothetical protein